MRTIVHLLRHGEVHNPDGILYGRLAGFKYKDVARKLRTLGFTFDRQARGSHEIWRHEVSGRKATLVRHVRPIEEGTLRSILRQAAIDVDEFLRA